MEEWVVAHNTYRVVDTTIAPGHVGVVIAGPTGPPDLDTLQAAVATDAYPSPVLEVEWVESTTMVVTD